MKNIWQFFYNILFLPLFYLLIIFAALFNSKIKNGIKGRKRIFEELEQKCKSLNKSRKTIWFHSSSYGEFEQAKPIIEQLRKESDINIVVSFFSPSGYVHSRKYPYADLITYLPFDSPTNAKRFIEIIQPNLVVFMRYDIWPNHIWALKKNEIPCFLVDATMRGNSLRTLPLIKSFHKTLFRNIQKILTVSKDDANGFRSFNCSDEQLLVVGDTRFDRVHQRSLAAKESNLIKQEVFKQKKIFVAGSTWEQDEEVILPAFIKLAKFDESAILIIAPHEPTLLRLEKIEHEFTGKLSTIRFSHLNNYSDERVIIVDSIGILLTLYTYADAAFVGGSFKQNIHNVLEAAVYGIPVLFGPKIDNSQEAKQLVETGGGMLVRGKKEAYRRIRSLFSNEELSTTRGKIAYDYVQKNIGATSKIIGEINKIF
jgi:3-deoxy-D-manno-octulosonic-acid transferase